MPNADYSGSLRQALWQRHSFAGDLGFPHLPGRPGLAAVRPCAQWKRTPTRFADRHMTSHTRLSSPENVKTKLFGSWVEAPTWSRAPLLDRSQVTQSQTAWPFVSRILAGRVIRERSSLLSTRYMLLQPKRHTNSRGLSSSPVSTGLPVGSKLNEKKPALCSRFDSIIASCC
jgi:hypothetical protein